MPERIAVEHFEELLHEIEKYLRIASEERDVANQALDEFRRIRVAIEKLVSKGKMTLHFGEPTTPGKSKSGEESIMSPGKETDTQTILCTEVETDADGQPVTLDPANVVWEIDDPTIATATQNDGSAPEKPAGCDTFKAVKPVPPATNPRTAKVKCTDTKTGTIGT